MTTETKIGIGIVHCQSIQGSREIGFNKVYKSDNGKWSSIIDDTGDVFKHVKFGYETILRMIHFSKDGEGWYMCSMKPIPGRDEEYRASWVYFPSSLDLSQKDIKNVIEVAESQIRQKEFDSTKLQEVIQSYSNFIEDGPIYNVPSEQRGYAFRNMSSDYNLFDLYGCMYQKDFTQYEWVILMEKSLLTFKGDGVKDISNRKILESHVIKPTPNEFGFIPYHNGSEFQSPVRVMDGETLTIEFKKPGYISITKNIRSQADFAISARECKKYFEKNKFIACDSKTKKQIVSAKIKPLNATEDKDGLYWIFEERYLENVKIDIKAEGYTADSFVSDLRNKTLNDDIQMFLEPESHEYIFVLPLDKSVVRDRDAAEVVIQSQFAIKKSPFKGFECSGTPREGGISNKLIEIKNSSATLSGNNINHKGGNTSGSNMTGSNHNDTGQGISAGQGHSGNADDNRRKINKYIKSALWCILILAVAVALGYCVNEKFIKSNTCTVDRVEAVSYDGESSGLPGDDWSTAYGYLKEHTNQICKDDMECFEDFRGLYDIVNGYRFKDYIDYIDKHPHRDDILEIDEWKRLYDKSKEIGSNKKGVYNDEGKDQSITFENFFKKDFSKLENTDNNTVSEQETQQSSHNSGQQSSHNSGQQSDNSSNSQQTNNQIDNI